MKEWLLFKPVSQQTAARFPVGESLRATGKRRGDGDGFRRRRGWQIWRTGEVRGGGVWGRRASSVLWAKKVEFWGRTSVNPEANGAIRAGCTRIRLRVWPVCRHSCMHLSAQKHIYIQIFACSVCGWIIQQQYSKFQNKLWWISLWIIMLAEPLFLFFLVTQITWPSAHSDWHKQYHGSESYN